MATECHTGLVPLGVAGGSPGLPSGLETGLCSPWLGAGSRCLLLPSFPPWLISSSPSSLSSSLFSPPTLLRVSSAPPSIPAPRARTNLAFLLHGEQCPSTGLELQGAGRI